MRYLIIDTRFPSPVHVFLEQDPQAEAGFPAGLRVLRVTLETAAAGPPDCGVSVGPLAAVGQNPWHPERFREFRSDGAAAGAGFGLIEPRFVGATWSAYVRAFRPGGRTIPARG
jgi:hypothetical protein